MKTAFVQSPASESAVPSLESLSLKQKIGQTSQEAISSLLQWGEGDLASTFAKYPVGSVFAGRDVIGHIDGSAAGMAQLICDCQKNSAIPLSVAGDLENGAGQAIPGMTTFPMLMALGAADREQIAYDYGRLTACESTAVGFNWTFAPVADLALNWLNPAVFTRCVGSDPECVAAIMRSLIHGFQEHGLSATAKHFPGDGVDFRNQHLQTAINALSKNDWFESFGKVYSACIKAGVQSVMAGHIALPWLDKAVGRGGRPRPATVSPIILSGLLRSELGFEGVIVSDALIMAGFTGWASYEERIVQAFNAGVDVMLWPGRAYFSLMERAIEDGRITETRLNEAVARILVFKERQGLFRQDARQNCREAKPSVEAKSLSRQLAEESLTLVRNEAGLVPLPPQVGKKVLLLFSTPVPHEAKKTISPMVRALVERGAKVTLHVNGNCLDIHKMEESGENFDTFLCVYELGMHMKSTSRPAGDMAECLWTQQYTDTLRPITVSLGTPYLLNELPHIDTLINAYGSATEVQQAVVALLCGEKMFLGKSPVPTGGDWINPFMGGNVLSRQSG